MTSSRCKTQQQTPPPESLTVSPSASLHLTGVTDDCPRPFFFFFFFFFSCSTTGFKFFQTSVAFHRGMAVQHKAESRHAPSNQTAEALPGNRACSGTPTHWGLSSAVTLSGSHLVSPWKKRKKRKENNNLYALPRKSRLLRCLLSSNVSYQIKTYLVFVFFFLRPSHPSFLIFFHPELPISPYSPSIGFFSPPPLLLLDNSWIRLMYSSLSSPLWLFYLFAFHAGESSRANTHKPLFFSSVISPLLARRFSFFFFLFILIIWRCFSSHFHI